MKDNFSKQALLYLRFRPGYPQQLYHFLLFPLNDKKTAWDCGTGNGQVAAKLSHYFDEVYATDISANQLANSVKRNIIYYSIEDAEQSSFTNNKFDLVTSAQSIHWFNFEQFYKEAGRTLKADGLLSVFGYSLMGINNEISTIIDDFYENITGPYWDKERKYVDENYTTIPFPFEIKTPVYHNEYEWEYEQVIGYLNTWSAVQHFIKINDRNPVDEIIAPLKRSWANDAKRKVSFPIL